MQRLILFSSTLAVVVLLSCAFNVIAEASDARNLAETLTRAGLRPKQDVILQLSSGDSLRGSFVRFRDAEFFTVRRYLASDQRFSLQDVNLKDLNEVRLVRNRSSVKYLLHGAIIGGGCGAASGYLAGSRNQGGDEEMADTRGIFTAGGFLLGSVTGALVGAIVTPARTQDLIIWSEEE